MRRLTAFFRSLSKPPPTGQSSRLHAFILNPLNVRRLFFGAVAVSLLHGVWSLSRSEQYKLHLAKSRLLSRLTGILASIPIPLSLRTSFFSKFASFYDIDLDEVKLPLQDFRSFRDFFIRELKDGSRP